MGVIYFKGHGVNADVRRSFEYFRSACLYGSIEACQKAGISHFYDMATKKDYRAALELFEKGCELNDAYSCFHAAAMRLDNELEFLEPERGLR